MEIKQALLTNPAARPRRKITPKGLVVHWVANPGTSAMANRNYFENGVSEEKQNWASAHYVVDDNNIIQCIPDDEMAYHVGATTYNQATLKKFGTTYPNDCLIGIEMCHTDWDGHYGAGTWANAVWLAAHLCLKWGFTPNEIVRHYDVTWKECPRLMVRDPAVFEKFKADVWEAIRSMVTPIDKVATVTASMLNVRTGPGTQFAVVTTLPNGAQVPATGTTGDWVQVEVNGQQCYVSAQWVTLTDSVERPPAWAQADVDTAIKHGILKGDGGGRYRFNDPVTRVEAVVMIVRAMRAVLKIVGKESDL